MTISWDTKTYDASFSFVHQYGQDVLGLLDLPNNSTMLDLGCGNGALTQEIADRGFAAIGLDQSPEFIQAARAAHPDLTFIEANATQFSLTQPVDAVFSNAVLHWIDKYDHPALLSCVYNALKPEGQFVFECGGFGNNKAIHEALKIAFYRNGYPYYNPFYFPTITEYSTLLEQAGFLVTYATLFNRPTPLKGNDGMAEWIRMFIKAPFERVTNETDRVAIINEAADILRPLLYKNGIWYADYVRLRMKAVRFLPSFKAPLQKPLPQ